MDANLIPEWSSACEREFEALFAETTNGNPSDEMDVLAESFPEKTMQQLSGEDPIDAFVDILNSELDVEPGTNGAASDTYDAYNLLDGDTDGSDLDPSIPVNQPSKQAVVEVAGIRMPVQNLGYKTRRKTRRAWSTEEQRQFLYGVQRLGRGEWKAISKYYVPSRTPLQLASHAQKFFKRIDKNDYLYDKTQSNGVKLSSHDRNNTELISSTEPEKGKPSKSSTPQPMSTDKDISFLDDMNFQDDLVQGMPTFGQTSNTATNLARQMPLNKRTLPESLGTANHLHGDDIVLPLYGQGRKSKPRKRRAWSTEEHRQFLLGVQHFGRGEWKAISKYYVPSRAPTQLASHAQKFFKRIDKNDDLYDKTQSNDEPEQVEPTDSNIPQPMSTEDISFLDDLVQEMTTFEQASNSATNLSARQVPLNNGTLESLLWETLSTFPPKEQGSVLLDQTGGISAEAGTVSFYRQSLGTANQIHNDNTLLPGVFTAQNLPQAVPLYGQGGYNPTNLPGVVAPSNQYNVHSTMPPPF